MNCKDFREVVDSYLSDELLTETNHEVLLHMENCLECRDEIEARRSIRNLLRSAVRNEGQYLIGEDFAKSLQMNLRQSIFEANRTGNFLSPNRNSWIAIAAGLLIMFSIGFIFLNQTQNSLIVEKKYTEPYLISDLPSAHIVNVALGDHEYCAINRGSSGDHKVSLVKASDGYSDEYNDMEKVVMPPLKKVLANYEFIESHFCKYKDVKFAHSTLRNRKSVVSILVTDSKGYEFFENKQIQKFSADKYRLACLDVQEKAIFVVSDLDEQKNFKATKALFNPMQKYFSKLRTASNGQIFQY